MIPDLHWIVPTIAVMVIAFVLFHQWEKKRSYRQWLYLMRRTMRLPDMKDCGDGWVRCTCTECYHRFLWWREDECLCTKCGADYYSKHDFDKPPEDWRPTC